MPHTAVSMLFLDYKDFLCVLGYQEFPALHSSPTDQVQIPCDKGWFSLRLIPQGKTKKPSDGSEAVCVENLPQKIVDAPGKHGELHSHIFSGI